MTHQARPPPAAAPTNRGAQVRNACWATLFTNACLLPCLTVLAQSLKQHRTRYPLVVMVTEQVDYATRAIIAKIGCVLRPVEHLSVDVSTVGRAAHPECDGIYPVYQRLDQVARV